MSSVYVIDSSALIDLHWTYPADTFDLLWTIEVEGIVRARRLVSSEEVFNEIDKKDDGLTEWSKNHTGMFVQTSTEIAKLVLEIMNDHPGLVKYDMINPIADPFVIALARTINEGSVDSSTAIVVAHEKRNIPVKIPAVCNAYGIANMTLLEMFRAEGWKF